MSRPTLDSCSMPASRLSTLTRSRVSMNDSRKKPKHIAAMTIIAVCHAAGSEGMFNPPCEAVAASLPNSRQSGSNIATAMKLPP